MLFHIFSGLLLLNIIYFRNCFINCGKYIKNKYSRFRELNKLVSTQEKVNYKIIWISFGMLLQVFYISLIQKLNKSLHPVNNRTYLLTYTINGNLYKIYIDKRRGPTKVLLIIDKNNNDITQLIEPYLGPNQDFHNRKFTPQKLGYDQLTFHLSDGSNKIYNENDVIIF